MNTRLKELMERQNDEMIARFGKDITLATVASFAVGIEPIIGIMDDATAIEYYSMIGRQFIELSEWAKSLPSS